MNSWLQGKPQPTTVRIYGTEYSVRSQADPEHVRQIAEAVDHEMRRISQHRVIKSPMEAAVLAAMHLADELFRTRRQLRDVLQRVGDTTEAMAQILDAELSARVNP